MVSTEGIPFYAMGNMTLPRLDDGLIYHYTTFEGLLGILKTMSIRMSPLDNLNDLSEGKIFHQDYEFKWRFEEFLKTCQIICFCRNYANESVIHEGTNRPRNWAHYGDNCKGACLVLRSEDFIKENRKKLDSFDFSVLEKVDYKPIIFSNHFEGKEDGNVVDFMKIHYRKILYSKYCDWENEDETRLLCCGIKNECDRYLSILNSIDSICLGERLLKDDKRMEKLVTVLSNSHNSCWRKFCPNSFSSVSSSPAGYFTDGVLAATTIDAIARTNKNRMTGLRLI